MKLWKTANVLGFVALAALAYSTKATDSAKITYAAFESAFEIPGGKGTKWMVVVEG